MSCSGLYFILERGLCFKSQVAVYMCADGMGQNSNSNAACNNYLLTYLLGSLYLAALSDTQ